MSFMLYGWHVEYCGNRFSTDYDSFDDCLAEAKRIARTDGVYVFIYTSFLFGKKIENKLRKNFNHLDVCQLYDCGADPIYRRRYRYMRKNLLD